MSMEQIGYVVEIKEEVKIRVMRESACGGNCASCHGCPSGVVFVRCPNDPSNPYFVGEQVVIQMPTAEFLGGTFGSYGTMSISMLMGAILGYAIFKQELISVFGGFLGLILGVFLVRIFFLKRRQNLIIKRQDKGKQ